MKILVIENDKEFCDAWVGHLRKSGHPVIPYYSLENLRVDDVAALDFGLALIDRRVRDDQDELDSSGEDFAVALNRLGTPCALVTGFPGSSPLFDLLRSGSVVGIALKSIPMEELALSVTEFCLSRRFPNCLAKFRWRGSEDESFAIDDWSKIKQHATRAAAAEEEFAVLFRGLIPACATNVELQLIAPGHGGAALARAWVSSDDGPVVEEVAIKYADRDTIRSEAMRYDRHVGPLPDGVAAQLRWRKETKNLAALAYSWVGDSIDDGIPFGPPGTGRSDLTWVRRRRALDRLFSISLNPWYRVFRSGAARVQRPLTVLEFYSGVYRFSPFTEWTFQDSLPSPVTLSGEVWDFNDFGKKPNPLLWLTQQAGQPLALTRLAPCHGDLHVKNIFVLPDDSPRLIDFGDTALGHVFHDFSTLEASIRLTCLRTLDLSAISLAVDCVASVNSLGEHIDYRSVPEQFPDLREVLRTIMYLRRAAWDAVGDHADDNLREYLLGLTIRALRYASGVADEAPSRETEKERATRVWHALYLAACTVEQIKRLG